MPTLMPFSEAVSKSFTTDGGVNPLELKTDTKTAEIAVEEKLKPEEVKTEIIPAKGLGDVSDATPATEEKLDTDDRKPGEKDSAFIKRIKAEKADLLNQLKQAREQTGKRSADPDEIAAIKAERDELEKTLEMTAYEKSRRYQTDFAKPIAKAEDTARSLVETFCDEKGAYERLAGLKGRERFEYLREHAPEGAALLFDKLQQIDDKKAERDAALANRAEVSKAVADERVDTTGPEILAAFDSARGDMAKRLSVYRSDKADTLDAQARALLTGDAPREDVIAAARMAVVLPHYLGMVNELTKENALLKARVAEQDADGASVNGRGRESSREGEGVMEGGKLKPMSQMLKAGFKK